jgi:hypothetical protein
MTRQQLLPAVQQAATESGEKIYIGRDGCTIDNMGEIKFTEDYDEGPYFYASERSFAMLYRYACPIGVIAPGDSRIFWSREDELLAELANVEVIRTVEDVRCQFSAEDIFVTDDVAIGILQMAQRGHDAEHGITWDVLREQIPEEEMTIAKGYASPKLIAERMAELRIIKTVEAETRTADFLSAMFSDDERPEELVFDSIPTQEALEGIVRAAMVHASHEEWVAAAEERGEGIKL